MNKNINWGSIVAMVAILLLAGFAVVDSGIKADLREDIDSKDADLSAMAGEVSLLSSKIDELTLAAIPDVETDAGVEMVGYDVDGLKIGKQDLNEKFSDRELNLFDGDVEFDDEDYSADEYFEVLNVKLTTNEDDFGSDVYAVVPEGALVYTIEFEDSLDTDLIDADESLEFNFLGDKVEIIDWSDGEVTFKKVDEMIVAEGDSISVEGTVVVLDMVMDGAVYVTSDGEAEKISEGKSASIGDIEVYVSEVLYTEKDSKVSKAVLSIGSEVEETVADGDEYEESMFEWIVGDNILGIVLAEEFKDLDEDNMPLGVGDSVCLPKEYICVMLSEMSDEDYSEYTFDYDLSDDELEIKGDFEVGTDDVDELLANATGLYYEDEDGDMQEATGVALKDSDAGFSYVGGLLSIRDVSMPFTLSSIDFGNGAEDEEGSYRSNYGSVVELDSDLEADEDNELSLYVPEERVEFTFLVY